MDEFYRQPNTLSGVMGKCKACWRQQVREARHKNPRVREYDRERSTQPHRIANATRVTRAWRQKHPERQRAQNVVAKSAEFVAPTLCEGCGLPKRVEKHHPDYSKPLLVVWLCKPCHAIADKIRRRLEAS